MKGFLGAIALFCGAMSVGFPADATSFVIDGTHAADLTFDGFDFEIPFSMELLGTAPASFTASFHGLITADPRYCADFPPGEEPADCDAAIDPVSAEDSFTAGAGESDSSLFLPFFLSGTGNGWMHFSQTDGSAVRINIQNATLVDTSGLGSGIGSAVPEPAAWTMMLLGFAFVGRALRSRRVSFGALRGDGTIAAKLRRRR